MRTSRRSRRSWPIVNHRTVDAATSVKLLSWKLSHNPENATHVGQHNARRVEQGIGLGEFLTRLECLHWWRSIVGAKSKSRAIEPAPILSGFD